MSHCSPELEAPPHFSFCTNTVVAGVRIILNVVMMIFAVIAASMATVLRSSAHQREQWMLP